MNTAAPEPESLKETLISIVIAFALAFVFRGFIAEAFVIPTGSMAPTLLGQHMRFHGSASGYDWAVGPWYSNSGNSGDYMPVQGNSGTSKSRLPVVPPISVNDPMSGEYIEQADVPLRAGDRILVLKYIYGVTSPQRYDVIVFNNPNNPEERYIKRLIGLPGEQIALVDGDVFARPAPADFAMPSKHDADALAGEWGAGLSDAGGWKIARKPDHVQRALWQTIFDSEYTPVGPGGVGGGAPDWFRRPWASPTQGWSFEGPTYRWKPSSIAASTQLVFNQNQPRFTDQRLRSSHFGSDRSRETWQIDDRYAYDEIYGNQGRGQTRFPVSDLRLRAGLEVPGDAASSPVVTAVIEVRGHIFAAEFAHNGSTGDGTVTLRVRKPIGESGVLSDWQTIADAPVQGLLTPGGVDNVEFWHSDQRLEVWVNDHKVIEETASLDWSPAQRVFFATGKSLLDRINQGSAGVPDGPLSQPEIYVRPEVRWEVAGGPLTMHRVALDRDLFYQPRASEQRSEPLRATDPTTILTLTPDQLFACGDNSPASFDGRAWTSANPWVRTLIDRDVGVVPRDLLIGKAFFVYFPALLRGGPGPMIDFGRMRFIW